MIIIVSPTNPIRSNNRNSNIDLQSETRIKVYLKDVTDFAGVYLDILTVYHANLITLILASSDLIVVALDLLTYKELTLVKY